MRDQIEEVNVKMTKNKSEKKDVRRTDAQIGLDSEEPSGPVRTFKEPADTPRPYVLYHCKILCTELRIILFFTKNVDFFFSSLRFAEGIDMQLFPAHQQLVWSLPVLSVITS